MYVLKLHIVIAALIRATRQVAAICGRRARLFMTVPIGVHNRLPHDLVIQVRKYHMHFDVHRFGVDRT